MKKKIVFNRLIQLFSDLNPKLLHHKRLKVKCLNNLK